MIRLGALCMLLLLANMVMARSLDPEQAIEDRIHYFRDIGTAFKYIRDELKEETPNAALIRKEAQRIKDVSEGMLAWFPKGSEPSLSASEGWFENIFSRFFSDYNAEVALPGEVKTNAKIDIWKRPEEFKKAYNHFDAAMNRLILTVEDGGISHIEQEFKNVGSSCKGCHDSFREEID